MSNARAKAAARRRAMQSAAAPAPAPSPAAPARTLGPTVVERFFNASFPNNAFRPRPAAAAVTGPTRLPPPTSESWQDTAIGPGTMRADGKVWVDKNYGFQSVQSAAKLGMGSELLDGRGFAPQPAPPAGLTRQPSQSGARWQDAMFGGRAAAGQPPASGSWAPAAQQNPRLPAGRNVAIVTPRSQGQNRALDQAAQNAGLPAWNWKAEENAAMLQAAQARESAAMAAREAQGGRGYVTADNLPGTLDQSQAAYWQGADMQAWAAANPKLAQAAMARAGYNPQAAAQGSMPERMTTEDAILRAQAAGALDSLKPGATSDDAILAGQAAGAFDGGQINSAVTQAVTPGRMTTEDAILRAQGMGALDGLRPGATSDDAILAGQAAGAFDSWSNPADEQRRRAAALSNSYLRAIQQHGMGLG